ncbi:unnamed protein product [Rotaria sordida]|uniref:TLC domain-containing protein n=1 Tax=Rotaria sordida TaxID=392033 RepID=A0A814M324_9BILA|nr:unnamed protein product [Rotaria sordida]CAF1088898.1 unnamed protein product [Rotaria sordida]CAF3699689.1 unnamed protein product [Rotaria sordida]
MWNEQFWLPRNTTWNDFLELEQKGIRIPQLRDLIYVYPLAGILYIIRVLFEYYIARPIGRAFGIQDTHLRNSHVTRLGKFNESFWRFTFYFTMSIYGIIILQNKSWTWDTRHCWLNYPNHPLTDDIFWYYMIELANYWSLIFSQFIDVKRKDFWQMFIHHIATIALLSFSYMVNFVRIGTLVIVIHDCGDYWLEGGKMAKYARAQKICDTLFIIFAIVWFITRLCYYPYKVLYSTTFEELTILGSFPALYGFNGLLILLQILHYFWFYLICRVAISAFKAGKVEKDNRSDSDESDDESSNKNVDIDKYK